MQNDLVTHWGLHS